MPTPEDVISAVNRRAKIRYNAYREERYQLINVQHISSSIQDERTRDLRILMDLHSDYLTRVLNDTSISVTIPHRPGSHRHTAATANYLLDIDLIGTVGYPRGTEGVITAYTEHTYILDWSPR